MKDFLLYTEIKSWLTNGDTVNIVILYSPDKKMKKFLASDYLDGEGLIRAWNYRWPVEKFHKYVNDLGMVKYQARAIEGLRTHTRVLDVLRRV